MICASCGEQAAIRLPDGRTLCLLCWCGSEENHGELIADVDEVVAALTGLRVAS